MQSATVHRRCKSLAENNPTGEQCRRPRVICFLISNKSLQQFKMHIVMVPHYRHPDENPKEQYSSKSFCFSRGPLEPKIARNNGTLIEWNTLNYGGSICKTRLNEELPSNRRARHKGKVVERVEQSLSSVDLSRQVLPLNTEQQWTKVCRNSSSASVTGYETALDEYSLD